MDDPSDATATWQWHGSRVAAIENPRGEIEWRLLTVTWQPDLSFNQGI
jgi:hypothetical protein